MENGGSGGMGMNSTIDLLMLVCGAYLIWTSFMAKRRGNITANVMLGKQSGLKDIKDKEGFIDYMYKRVMIAGLLIIAGSVVYLINDYYVMSHALTWIGSGLIVVAMIVYIRAYKGSQKKYMKDRGASVPKTDDNKKES